MDFQQDDWQIAKLTGLITTVLAALGAFLKLVFGHREVQQSDAEKFQKSILDRLDKVEADSLTQREQSEKRIEELLDKLDKERERFRLEEAQQRQECNEKIDVLREENHELRRRLRILENDPTRLPIAALPLEGIGAVMERVKGLEGQAAEINTGIVTFSMRQARIEEKLFGSTFQQVQIEEKK